MIRAVLDANILVSAAIKESGKSHRILDQGEEKFVWLVSDYILDEVVRVLERKHIQSKYKNQVTSEKRRQYLARIRATATLVQVKTVLTAVPRDLRDNPILACAKDGQATYVVTGDRHLLELATFEGIQIVTPAEFLEILSRQ